MERDNFYKFLRKGGRTEDVAERVIRLVETYVEYLLDNAKTNPDEAHFEDLDAFVEWIDIHGDNLPKHDQIHPCAKSFLWAIRYYYKFTGNKEMANHSGVLRKNRIRRKPFALNGLRGVDLDHLEVLKAHRITNVKEMLKAGASFKYRRQLAEKTGIPERAITELTRLSDLARLPGVKGIRARLYLDAGIDSIEKLASMSEDKILEITRKFVEETGFDGIPPLPAEVRHTIAAARSLPVVVDLD